MCEHGNGYMNYIAAGVLIGFYMCRYEHSFTINSVIQGYHIYEDNEVLYSCFGTHGGLTDIILFQVEPDHHKLVS